MPALGRPRRSVSDRINPIGSIAADGEYSIRWGRFHPIRRGAESSRPGVSPHRQQASVRSLARPCRNICGLPTTHTFCPVTNTFRPIAPLPSNLARNSPAAPSNIEFASLELQRFRMVSKNYRLKLCAKFVWAGPAIARRRRGQAWSQGLAVLTGPSGGAPHLWRGFCTIRSLPSACRRRVAPLLVQFPPFGGGEVAARGGVVPNVQTTSAKNADNGQSWARWSALWAQRRLAWRVGRTFTPEM